MGANEGVPDEDVGWLVVDGVEEREGVGEVSGRGKGAELDELALGEEGVVETAFDDEGVDLFEAGDVGAFGKQIQMRVVFKKLVWRVRGRKKVNKGRGKTRHHHRFLLPIATDKIFFLLVIFRILFS